MMYCANSAHAYRFYENLVSNVGYRGTFESAAYFAVGMRLCVAYRLRLKCDVVQQCDVVARCHQVQEELDVPNQGCCFCEDLLIM